MIQLHTSSKYDWNEVNWDMTKMTDPMGAQGKLISLVCSNSVDFIIKMVGCGIKSLHSQVIFQPGFPL